MGEPTRHLYEAGLGDRVRDIPLPRLERRQIGDVHDYPAFAHRPCGSLGEKKWRAEIEREHRVPVFDENLADRSAHHHRRRVDEDIQPTEHLGGMLDEAWRRRRIGEISRQGPRIAAGGDYLLRDFARSPLRAGVMHSDSHPRLAQRQCDDPADARSRAGHQRDATVYLHVALSAAADTDATFASCCSSQSAGTLIAPSRRGPSSPPCQSEPPLGTRSKNSQSACSRFVSSREWPGCLISTPSRPAATSGSNRSRRPASPGCAHIASAPPSCAMPIASTRESLSFGTNAAPDPPRYRANASRKSWTTPRAISARAMCGRPTAPPADCCSTSSNVIGIPRVFSFSTMRWPREYLIARSSVSRSSSRSSRDRCSARRWTSWSSRNALSSTAAMTLMPSRSPASLAASTPSIVSWSVSAIALSPHRAAASTTRSGGSIPSEAVE